jgi:hypothetical protein
MSDDERDVEMRARALPRRMAVPIIAVLAALLLAPGTAGASGRSPGHVQRGDSGTDDEVTTVATGLDNPRGLDFSSDGSLYVAESGRGGDDPCFPGPEGDEVCFGTSGAITRVRDGQQSRIITGLPSVAAPDGSAAIGPTDVAARGTLPRFTVGLGADPALRDSLPEEGQEALGWLLRQRGRSGWRQVADVAGFEADANPDGGLPDSNPTSVFFKGGSWYMADAGGNSLVRLDPRGRLSTVAVFPDRLVDAPEFLQLPPGTQIPMQSVPTSVVRGPDGAFYVGELTGFPFVAGSARVHRVVPGGQPEVVAEGFTNIVDIAFDRHGRLYVLEIDSTGLATPPGPPDFAGALIRVLQDGSHEVVMDEGLFGPGGLTIRGDAAYVSNCGVCAGTGEVLRIPLD